MSITSSEGQTETREIACLEREDLTPTTQVRTVFGTIPGNSSRLYQCPCQPQPTKTYSPLAALIPEHITPELLFLETKWAALVSYGVTAQLLHEVQPIDDALAPCTIREHVFTNTLRQRVSRLVRDTLSFSKKLAHHIGAMKYFICHDNLTRAAALPV